MVLRFWEHGTRSPKLWVLVLRVQGRWLRCVEFRLGGWLLAGGFICVALGEGFLVMDSVLDGLLQVGRSERGGGVVGCGGSGGGVFGKSGGEETMTIAEEVVTVYGPGGLA